MGAASQEEPARCFICVLGVHRSGTSVAAGLLSIFGFHPGKSLVLPDRYNSYGYYECLPIVELNDQILKASSGKWSDIRGIQPSQFPRDREIAKFSGSGAAIFEREFDSYESIVIKDPRFCYLYPFWKRIFGQKGREEFVVISIRHPSEVTASLRHRDGFPESKGAALYVSYILSAELNTRGTKRVIWDYDSVITDWRNSMAILLSETGITLPNSSKACEAEADRFVSRELKHQNSGWARELEEFDVPMQLALEIYNLLRFQISKDTEAALDRIRLRFEGYMRSLDPWLADSYKLELLGDELLVPKGLAREAAGRAAQSVLYWSSKGSDLSEANTIRHPWKFGPAFNFLRFVFDREIGIIDTIRWDVTDRPAFVQLVSILLEDAAGGILWTWQPGSDLLDPCSSGFFALGGDNGLLESVDFLITGFDPQFYLKIPSKILAFIGPGCVLSAKFTAEMPSLALPALIAKISTLSDRLREFDESVQLTNEIGKVLKAPRGLQGSGSENFLDLHSNIREELSRVEAQLSAARKLINQR